VKSFEVNNIINATIDSKLSEKTYFITLTPVCEKITVWTSIWPIGLNLPLWLTMPIYQH